jgi:type IV pilus assembly protein PilY1
MSGINACTSAKTGNCTIAGYSATRNNSVVTITPPAVLGNIAFTPVVTSTGPLTFTASAFAGGLPGGNVRVDVVSTNDSYPYPGTSTRATTRTDCAGTTCTYQEEMTNYANWWAYYRTRMQMMKTSASIAFKPVDSKYRVGYMTINNNNSADFVNISKFDNTQKLAWYNKFFTARPGSSTPLRAALSDAGQIFAGKKNGTSFNGVTVIDPMQYSCQQNFTLLTTDGYWNGTAGSTLSGGAIGQRDGVEPRPYNDGANRIETVVTPSVTTVRKQTVTNVKRDTTYTRTNTIVGAACSVPSSASTSCVQDNGGNSSGNPRTWCMVTTTSGQNGECSGQIAAGIFACRGIQNATNSPNPGSPTPCKTDASGNNWCVYDSNATANTSGCVLAMGGDNIYVCKASAAVSGNQVTVQNQSYTQSETGASSTSIDDTATTTNSTTVYTNGVGAPAQPNTPAGSTTTTNVSTSTTTYTTDSGAPGGSTSWTTASSTGPTCTAAASVPAAGATTPAISSGPTVVAVGSATVTTLSTTGPVVGTPTTTSTSATGGVSDTLADVAEYYYITDLRSSALGNCTGAAVSPATTGVDVCTDNVAGAGLDKASWQHMTTFTLGLANGVMQYSPTYPTQTSGDYFDVKNGTTANPAGGVCSWQTSGACNWPIPGDNLQTNIDDLWHAAVNGRGSYYSATSPTALAAGLNSALAGVNARTGSSAAATTSNPNVTSGDNFVFSSTFTSNEWDGEVVRQQQDLVTGNVSKTIDWAAQAQLDLLAYGSRVIYTFDSASSTTKLKLFTYANLTSTEQANFNTPAIAGLSQFCSAGATCLTAADQTSASGTNLVNFIRGDRANEGASTDTTKFYRARFHVLGDVVNAEAVYVKQPPFSYGDTGYSAYVGTQASRQGTVYIAANDGMLHAFNATNGAESWTYIPAMVMPELYRLADKNYAHRYFVDGTPVSGDLYDGTAWRTIVVGGLNAGGKGYYALDVTDPANPKALWEFTDTNMGYTFGNPVISKLANGTWVVFVTSGYNNNATGQDGMGHLYVLNAVTGALIRDISTGVGDATTPSGLGKISAWVDNPDTDNTTLRVYGGDMLGNVWRFDVNNTIGAAGYDAQKLITLYADTAGTVTEPITTRPELGNVAGVAVVFVGTGRYLGLTDKADVTQQAFYGVKDALTTTTLGNPRDTTASGPKFVKQAATNTTCPVGTPTSICTTGQLVRTSTSNTVNFAVNNGWFIDLPDSGERANTDPTLALGTLGFTTNIPASSACTAGGTSFTWALDYRSGAPVSTSTTGVSSVSLGNALATRGVFERLPNNTVVQLTRTSDGSTVTTNVPVGAGAAGTRRVSWRELISDQ